MPARRPMKALPRSAPSPTARPTPPSAPLTGLRHSSASSRQRAAIHARRAEPETGRPSSSCICIYIYCLLPAACHPVHKPIAYHWRLCIYFPHVIPRKDVGACREGRGMIVSTASVCFIATGMRRRRRSMDQRDADEARQPENDRHPDHPSDVTNAVPAIAGPATNGPPGTPIPEGDPASLYWPRRDRQQPRNGSASPNQPPPSTTARRARRRPIPHGPRIGPSKSNSGMSRKNTNPYAPCNGGLPALPVPTTGARRPLCS